MVFDFFLQQPIILYHYSIIIPKEEFIFEKKC